MRAIVLVCAWCVACGPSAESIYLEWPDAESARSAIVAITAEEQISIWALEVDRPRHLEPSVAWSQAAIAQVEILLYDETLVELGLAEGILASDPDGGLIPRPAIAFVTEVADNAAGEWRSTTEQSPELRKTKVPRDPRALCNRFVVEHKYGLGSGFDHAFGLSLGPDAVLVGTLEGRVFRVDFEGVQEVTVFPPGLPFGDALRDERGQIWFAGRGGALWRGTVSTEPELRIDAVPVATSSRAGQIQWMAGRVEPEIELYTLDDTGSLELYDGTGFRVLHTFSTEFNNKGGVASPRPGEAWAGKGNRAQVVRLRDGVVEDVTPPNLMNGVTAVADIPDLGVVFSAGQGRVFKALDPEGWVELPGSSVELDVYTLQAFDQGFLYGGALGFLAEYRASTETFCLPEQLGSGSVRRVMTLGDHILLAEDKPLSRLEASVTILKVVPGR